MGLRKRLLETRVNLYIVKSAPISEVLKADQIAEEREVGTTGSSGVHGVNESHKLTDEHGKSWLFKPRSGEHKSKWRYIPYGGQYHREKLAYLIDKELKFGHVPPTIIVKYEGEIGSAQRWVEDADKSDVTLKSYSEQDIWEVGIFDMVIGNTDRHSGNWLSKDGEVIAIDHGYAFPNKAGVDDKKSVILSRFSFAIKGKEIPQNILKSLENLRNKTSMKAAKDLLDFSSFELYKNRIKTLIYTQTAFLPDYMIHDKLSKIPKE
jgi:hypothetical protein